MLDEMSKNSEQTPRLNSVSAWILAARPKTLTGAAVPVVIGATTAWHDAGSEFQWLAAVLCLLFAFIMQIDANFVNDYFDFRRGNDDETRLGPKRACAEGWVTPRAMIVAIVLTTALACLVGLPLVIYGGWEMVGVGAACVLFCFLYTTCLSYFGLGDLLVLVFFGLVPVCCTYWVCMPAEAQSVTPQVFLYSIACGLIIDTLLLVNNYRDYDNDRRAGKRTLVVLVGRTWGQRLYLLAGMLGVVLTVVAALMNFHGAVVPALMVISYGYYHYKAWRHLCQRDGRQLNRSLGETSANMLSVAFYFILEVVMQLF